MSNSLPSDEEIRGRVRTAMQDLIVRDSALAADVVPQVQGAVMEIVREFRLENERLEACADPDALVIVYGKGRAAERAVWRKRMPGPEVIEAIRVASRVASGDTIKMDGMTYRTGAADAAETVLAWLEKLESEVGND